VAAAGDTVVVSNGVYMSGGRLTYYAWSRVAVTNAIALVSVNGAQSTIIDAGGNFPYHQGDWASATNRCVSLTDGASLTGFTVTNGYLECIPGAGVYCTSEKALIINCILTGNYAKCGGGGAYRGTLYNCTVAGNGAGTVWGTGAGVFGSTLYNCILWFNTFGNYDDTSTLNYCFIGDPLFADYADGNLRLQSNSPCINAGNNAYVMTTTDADGNPRIVGGTVDIGAYEFQPGVSGAFIGWLQQYGLPTDGSADYADPDHDSMNNWQEWVCGTNPTNALSVLRMVSATPTSTNATVTWQSVAGVNYFLDRSANLASPFTLLATNIVGQAGTTSCTDTNATGAGAFFYRVGVTAP
jgi:hypothetical protein